jgi:hypothetical protein
MEECWDGHDGTDETHVEILLQLLDVHEVALDLRGFAAEKSQRQPPDHVSVLIKEILFPKIWTRS